MFKKLQKYDYYFMFAMLAGLLMYLLCIFTPDHFADETFHASIPLRFINGDSMAQQEWHLTQFSAIFLYIPVRIWLAITGSTEGMLLYLRFLYLAVHTLTAIGVYLFFRKHNIWAVAAAMLFYTLVPLRFLNGNYHSLLALFLLLFTLTILLIQKKNHIVLYALAGFFYFCCCVCNPFDCVLFLVYAGACIVKRKGPFFSGKAFLKFSLGVLIAVILCLIFFFATGGTIPGLLKNIPNILADGGHDIFASPIEAFREKIQTTLWHFSQISFGLPFLLPIFYLVLWFDKKRREPIHKLIYTIVSFVFAVFYTVGVTIGALGNSRQLAITLPLFIITTVCYILTEQKNKTLFYSMWIPAILAAVAQYAASDLHLSSLWVLNVCNIAGVFFIKDFCKELQPMTVNWKPLCKTLLCVSICLQIAFHGCIFCWGKIITPAQSAKVEKGPYAGFYMQTETYDMNMQMMADLDNIKARSNPDDPVLILSEFTWMYLYIDRPFATFSTWQPFLEAERLKVYYENNPDRKPKYIYIPWVFIPTGVTTGHVINPDRAQLDADVLKQMFDFKCQQEELSYGILLTINN